MLRGNKGKGSVWGQSLLQAGDEAVKNFNQGEAEGLIIYEVLQLILEDSAADGRMNQHQWNEQYFGRLFLHIPLNHGGICNSYQFSMMEWEKPPICTLILKEVSGVDEFIVFKINVTDYSNSFKVLQPGAIKLLSIVWARPVLNCSCLHRFLPHLEGLKCHQVKFPFVILIVKFGVRFFNSFISGFEIILLLNGRFMCILV